MDLLSHRAFNLFIYSSRRSVCKNHPFVLTVARLYHLKRGGGPFDADCTAACTEYFRLIWSCACESRSDLCRSLKVKRFYFLFFFQTDRVTQKSHPGDPENALLCGQEEFSGNSYICISINCLEQSLHAEDDVKHLWHNIRPTDVKGLGCVWNSNRLVLLCCLCCRVSSNSLANMVNKAHRRLIHFIMVKWNNMSDPLRGFLHF